MYVHFYRCALYANTRARNERNVTAEMRAAFLRARRNWKLELTPLRDAPHGHRWTCMNGLDIARISSVHHRFSVSSSCLLKCAHQKLWSPTQIRRIMSDVQQILLSFWIENPLQILSLHLSAFTRRFSRNFMAISMYSLIASWDFHMVAAVDTMTDSTVRRATLSAWVRLVE